jgi:hypothetical protein
MQIEDKEDKQESSTFECTVGEYQHLDYKLFDKKKSSWQYCKEFWGIDKKNNNCLS